MVNVDSVLPSFVFTSHPQLEKTDDDIRAKSSLKQAKEPKVLLIASAIAPVGSIPELGVMQRQ